MRFTLYVINLKRFIYALLIPLPLVICLPIVLASLFNMYFYFKLAFILLFVDVTIAYLFLKKKSNVFVDEEKLFVNKKAIRLNTVKGYVIKHFGAFNSSIYLKASSGKVVNISCLTSRRRKQEFDRFSSFLVEKLNEKAVRIENLDLREVEKLTLQKWEPLFIGGVIWVLLFNLLALYSLLIKEEYFPLSALISVDSFALALFALYRKPDKGIRRSKRSYMRRHF